MLKDIPLFAGLDENDLSLLEQRANTRTFPKHAILINEGDETDSLYVILSGCSATPAYRERSLALDVTDFLTKPVPLAKLTEVVSSSLREAKCGVPTAESPAADSARRGRSPLQGSFERVPFPALLHHLQQQFRRVRVAIACAEG